MKRYEMIWCIYIYLYMYIVTDLHLEHHFQNKDQKISRGMCSKYTLGTPAKNLHLEQVF